MTRHPPAAVVMGASAGGLDALNCILPQLPRDYPLPVMIVTHLLPERTSLLPELLRDKCRIAVREVEDKEPIRPGTVYVAPPDYHMLVEHDLRLSLSSEEPVHFSRPSIDVLFESAADVYRESLIGVVLSGANDDGTRGLQAILKAGGIGLVQDPSTAQAAIMPQSALNGSPTAKALYLDALAAFLLDIVKPQ